MDKWNKILLLRVLLIRYSLLTLALATCLLALYSMQENIPHNGFCLKGSQCREDMECSSRLKCVCKESKMPIEGSCVCKKPNSLICYFQHTTPQSNISSYNGAAFNQIMSTEMVILNKTPVYFFADHDNNALIKMSDSWQFIAKVKTIRLPHVIKLANDHLYVSSDHGFYKMDYNFNITKLINETLQFHGIYHNASDNTLAVAVGKLKRVDWFDLDLNVLENISLGAYQPYAVSGYGDSLFVSGKDSSSTVIHVIRNRQIINTLSISSTTAMYIFSIAIDVYGYMALTFKDQRAVELYHTNGTSTGFQLKFPDSVYHINFDFNRRIMISTRYVLYFFN